MSVKKGDKLYLVKFALTADIEQVGDCCRGGDSRKKIKLIEKQIARLRKLDFSRALA